MFGKQQKNSFRTGTRLTIPCTSNCSQRGSLSLSSESFQESGNRCYRLAALEGVWAKFPLDFNKQEGCVAFTHLRLPEDALSPKDPPKSFPLHPFTLDHRDKKKKKKNNGRAKTKQKHGAPPGRALPAAIKQYI